MVETFGGWDGEALKVLKLLRRHAAEANSPGYDSHEMTANEMTAMAMRYLSRRHWIAPKRGNFEF